MSLKTRLLLTLFLISLSLVVLLSYRYEEQIKSWPVFNFFINQRQEARQEAKLHKLNLYMIQDYGSLLDPASSSNKISIDDYIKYFKLIREYFPDQAEGYSLLGFCYAYQGDIQKALENYEKALILNPHFFWSYYNTALLLWFNGNTSQATILFKKSLSLSPTDTLTTIASSKVFRDILAGLPSYNILQSLKNGYQQTSLFIQMIEHQSPAPESLPPLKFF